MEYVDKTRAEFDAEVMSKANAFSCCWYHGRGEYTTNYFLTLKEAQEEKAAILEKVPDARVLLYAIIVGPLGPTREVWVE
jgi:hypothetical protein